MRDRRRLLLGLLPLLAILALQVWIHGVRGPGTAAIRVNVIVPPHLSHLSVEWWAVRPTESDLESDGEPRFPQGAGFQSNQEALGGAIEWDEIMPGRYILGVSFWPTSKLVYAGEVDVPYFGGAVAEVELPEPGAPQWLRVRLLGGNGEPVEDVTWRVEHGELGRSWIGFGVSGARVLHYVPAGHCFEYEEGTHWVEARSKLWGRVRTDFEVGTTETMELKFGPAVRASGVVRGYRGSGYEEAVFVEVKRPDDLSRSPWYRGMTLVGPSGEFVLPTEQPGEHTVVLYVGGNTLLPAAVAARTVNFQPGMPALNFEIPQLHSLRIVWNGGYRAIELISISGPTGGATWQAAVDGNGSAKFVAVPPGRYRLHSNDEQMTVEIPKQTEVRLR